MLRPKVALVKVLIKRPGLGKLENVSLGHGVSPLCWRSGGVEHPHDTPPYSFTPSPTLPHSSGIIAVPRWGQRQKPLEAPKHTSLAGTIWPSTQCGQTTDSFKLRNFASARASVSIEVLTSCEVFGQRYLRALIFHLNLHSSIDERFALSRAAHRAIPALHNAA